MRGQHNKLVLVILGLTVVGCRDATLEHATMERAGATRPETGAVSSSPIAPPSDPEAPPSVPDPEAVTAATRRVKPVREFSPAAHSRALREFLERFDAISARGFVPTLRSGSTGIGYTLESMLQIEENNSPAGDFLGMEIKAFRDDDLTMNDSEKMNLFLKEPRWIDGLNHADRIRRYGYTDDNGRRALYSTVRNRENSHGFCWRVDREKRRVLMQFKQSDVAYWTFDILEKRLTEKHSEAVFVAAHSRGKGRSEQFHYYAVTWCAEPDVGAFVELIEAGDVLLELRMHLRESGSARNHGSAFRIKQNRIPRLYARTMQVRP